MTVAVAVKTGAYQARLQRLMGIALVVLISTLQPLDAHEAVEGQSLNFDALIDAGPDGKEEGAVDQATIAEADAFRREMERDMDQAMMDGEITPIMRDETAEHFDAVHAEDESTLRTIETAEDLKEFMDAQKVTPGDMVVFDVDMVLTMPQNPLFQMPTLKQYRDIFRSFMAEFSPAQYDLALLYMVLYSPQIATHPLMRALVTSLIDAQIPTLYLTALPTGSFAQIDNVAEWRLYSLSSAGYIVQTGIADGRIYKQFPKYLGSRPKRADRLLMTNGPQGGVSKGAMLVAYLKEKGVHPKRLYMIDDQAKNLDEAVEALYAYDRAIKVIGIEYTGALHIPKEATEFAPPQVVSEQTFKEALTKIKKLVLANRF